MQNHINRLRQDLSAISATAQQLQQSEQQAQSQLARLSQHESLNSQQLLRITQICNSLQNDVSAISSAVQQISTAVPAFTTGQWGVGTGQFGTTGYTAGMVAPYTGYTPTAGVAPYTGFTTTAQSAPFYGSAAGALQTTMPNPNVNFPVTGASIGAAYGGTQAYRPWPDKDNPSPNIGTSFAGGTF